MRPVYLPHHLFTFPLPHLFIIYLTSLDILTWFAYLVPCLPHRPLLSIFFQSIDLHLFAFPLRHVIIVCLMNLDNLVPCLHISFLSIYIIFILSGYPSCYPCLSSLSTYPSTCLSIVSFYYCLVEGLGYSSALSPYLFHLSLFYPFYHICLFIFPLHYLIIVCLKGLDILVDCLLYWFHLSTLYYFYPI